MGATGDGMADKSLGAHLKATRKGLGYTLEEVAEETKIAIYVLRAMEADKWETLPAEVFIRGFLRSYAEVLGLDPAEVVERYCKESGLCDPKKKGIRPPPSPMAEVPWYKNSSVIIWGILAAAIVCGVVIFLMR